MLQPQQPQIVDSLPCAAANTSSLRHILCHCRWPFGPHGKQSPCGCGCACFSGSVPRSLYRPPWFGREAPLVCFVRQQEAIYEVTDCRSCSVPTFCLNSFACSKKKKLQSCLSAHLIKQLFP